MSFKEVEELEERIKNGEYDDNPLIDLILYYMKNIKMLEEENLRFEDINTYEEVKGELDLTQSLIVDDHVYCKEKFLYRIKNVLSVVSYEGGYIVVYTFNDKSFRFYKRVEK